jgi:hypothetical protein
MITLLKIEKELITILGNYSAEEIQFSNCNETFKIKVIELLNCNNENDIISYIENELYKSEIIKKYLDDKIHISFNDHINQQIVCIKEDLVYLDNFSNDLNEKLKGNNIKIEEIKNNHWGNDKYELEVDNKKFNENLTKVSTTKNSYLFQLEKFKQFLIENIDLSNYDVSASKKSLDFISKILFRNEIRYHLYFKSIEIEKKCFNIIEIDIYNYNKTFKEISSFFKNNIKINPNVIPNNWKKILFSVVKNLKLKFDGTYTDDDFALINNQINISAFDYSFFIALRNNLNQEEFITQDNLLFLPLSGGVMARIIFKNYTFSENENLVYVNGKINNNSFLNKESAELYSLDGYGTGAVNINVPKGYTFIIQNLFCQISFHATPILFENNTSKIFNNLSNDSKKYDDDNDYDEDYNYKKK